jgi:nucleoid-associated protein YgaU
MLLFLILYICAETKPSYSTARGRTMAPQQGENDGDSPTSTRSNVTRDEQQNDRDEKEVQFRDIRYGMESFYAIVQPGMFSSIASFF